MSLTTTHFGPIEAVSEEEGGNISLLLTISQILYSLAMGNNPEEEKKKIVREYLRGYQASRRSKLREEGFGFVSLEIPPDLLAALKEKAEKDREKLGKLIVDLLYKEVLGK